MAKTYFVHDGLTEAGGEIMNAFRLLPDELLSELEKLPRNAQKCLVVDSSLIVSLDIMLKKTDLQVYNIDKIYLLEEKKLPSEWKYIFYLVPSNMASARIIINHIKEDRACHFERAYTIGFVPKRNAAVETLMENAGCHGNQIRLVDFKLSSIPLDLDLVTLNCPQLFESVYLDRNFEYLEIFADSFLRVLTKLGIPWNEVRGRLVIGEMSQKIIDLLDTNVVKPTGDTYSNRLAMNHTITMALMDRDSDYVTPLLSQLIYEGRLDDNFGIKFGKMSVEADIINEERDTTMTLDWKDPIFHEIRHLDPTTAVDELRKKLVENREASETGRNLKTVQEVSRFVREDLKDVKQRSMLLSRHLDIYSHMSKDAKEQARVVRFERLLLDGSSDGCLEFIEEQLSLREGLLSSMRLMALWCVTHDGLPNNVYDSLVQLACQSYGYDNVLAFFNLKRAGLLYPKRDKNMRSQTKSFSQLRKYLELCCPAQAEAPGTVHKSGESYVFMGHHTPLISRLVERVFARSNKFKMEWFKGIPLTHLKYQQPVRFRGRQVIIIGFVGGCTYSEINSLRLLAKYYKIQIVIVTSCTLNSQSLIQQMQHDD